MTSKFIKKILKKIIPNKIIERIHLYKRFKKEFLRKILEEKNNKILEGKKTTYINNLLNSKNKIFLEIGSGNKKGVNGWTTMDLGGECDIIHDLTENLPFPDNSIEKIYSSHVLEHFKYIDLVKLLIECRRVLKKEREFFGSVPNALIYISVFNSSTTFDISFYCKYVQALKGNTKMDILNYIAYMDGEHKIMFDEEYLLEILKRAGFNNIKLRNYDAAIDLKERDYESIYFTCNK